MTYQYTLTTDDGTDRETLNDRLTDLTLTTTQDTREFTERNTELTDEPTEYRARVYLADTEPLEDADSELKSVVEDAESATIQRRHTWREYDDETIADPDYYDVNAEKGLRTNPTINHTEGYNVEVAAKIHIDGTEYDHSDTLEIPEPTDYARKDRLVATADGIKRIAGEPGPKPVNKLPYPDTPENAVSLGSVVVKEHIERIPRGGINTDTIGGRPSDWQTVYKKEATE